MKTKLTLFLTFLTYTLSVMSYAEGITDAERSKAIDHLKQSQKELIAAVKGLKENQLNFRSSSEAWSIAECVEHLAISEELIFGMAQGSLKEEVAEGKAAMSDDGIIGLITDRSNKVKTREPFEPTNKFGSHKETLQAFKDRRKNNIEYMQKTEDDLRGHYFTFPFGMADTYQVILFMSGHTQRHIKQIEEIKTAASFPD